MHIRSYGCTLSLRCTENRYTFKSSYFHTTEWMIVALRQGINFSAISWREQVTFRWDYAMFAGLEFFSASSLRKQSAGGKHVSPLAQIILILSQSVFGLTSQCLVEKQQISIPITYLRYGYTGKSWIQMQISYNLCENKDTNFGSTTCDISCIHYNPSYLFLDRSRYYIIINK
jgi:hypothetical protein